MKTTNSVILSETKNLIQSMGYETLHSVQGDTFRTFARASEVNPNEMVSVHKLMCTSCHSGSLPDYNLQGQA